MVQILMLDKLVADFAKAMKAVSCATCSTNRRRMRGWSGAAQPRRDDGTVMAIRPGQGALEVHTKNSTPKNIKPNRREEQMNGMSAADFRNLRAPLAPTSF